MGDKQLGYSELSDFRSKTRQGDACCLSTLIVEQRLGFYWRFDVRCHLNSTCRVPENQYN